jgi:hypothetical protein
MMEITIVCRTPVTATNRNPPILPRDNLTISYVANNKKARLDEGVSEIAVNKQSLTGITANAHI